MLNQAQLAAGFGIAIGLPLAVLIGAVVWPQPTSHKAEDHAEETVRPAASESGRNLSRTAASPPPRSR